MIILNGNEYEVFEDKETNELFLFNDNEVIHINDLSDLELAEVQRVLENETY